jgi:hypothetical protein
MSEYGRLWAEVESVRAILRARMPTISTNTYDEAVRFHNENAAMLQRWAKLEEQMRKCGDR